MSDLKITFSGELGMKLVERIATLEHDLAAAQAETVALRAKVADLTENGARLKAVADSAAEHAKDMVEVVAGPLRVECSALRAEVERLRSALGFYSQPVRYDGPNQRPIPGDQYTAADSAYMNDVCRDGGEIARAALAATEARPVNPDGLPTYDKKKALEWVAQLRDGNKDAKP